MPTATPSNLADPHTAIAALLQRFAPVSTERIALDGAAGRVLAAPVHADRPSPACDVSAMDGYAVRMTDVARGTLPIAGEVVTGQAPPTLPAGAAVRIFTGGAVPDDADAVIRRENVTEHAQSIELERISFKRGANIRHAGENIASGARVLDAGRPLTPATVAALASFGIVEPTVYRPVRVGVLVTGDEVLAPDAQPEPWQLRNSNGPSLQAMLTQMRWAELASCAHVRDEPGAMRDALQYALGASDVVLITGGVSMGDHDHVPEIVKAVGGEIVFHKLALRPGKPMLGAVTAHGQPILGLPGNPVSVLATARRFALPILRARAGLHEPDPPAPAVTLANPDDKAIGLWWYRPVCLTAAGEAALVPTMGSGDLVSAGISDGIVELPPHATGVGPWPFYAWSAP